MNTLGNIFKVHSFGESHGQAVGCIIDGCPAGLILDMPKIQAAVDRRKTAQHDFSSQRKESDTVQIISGVFEGKTLGSPICIIIHNEDAQSKDYSHLKDIYRPGHADYTNEQKYGFRDYRGGGRTSIRITAPLVAAGEIARQLIERVSNAKVTSFVSQIGSAKFDVSDLSETGISEQQNIYLNTSTKNIIDETFDNEVDALLKKVANAKDTLGGRISSCIAGLEVGLGEPIFGKFQAQLSQALFSINTVKAVEFGKGIDAAGMTGVEHNDAFIASEKLTETNNHSGLLGGITTGNRLVYHTYFKPISSLGQKQKSTNTKGEEVEIDIKGRHDVCAVPRAVSIVDAYSHIVLINLLLQNKYAKL